MRLNLIKYPGAKSYLIKWMYKKFPWHHTFVDVFGGAGTVTINKEPSYVDIWNDIDPVIYSMMYHVKYNNRISLILSQINCDIDTFLKYKDIYETCKTDGVYNETMTVATIVVHRMSRGGLGKDFSSSTRLRGGRIEQVNSWENFKLNFPKIANRLKTIGLYNRCFTNLITELDDKNTFFYADPPYFPDVVSASMYDYTMTTDKHGLMLDMFQSVQAKVMISGYDNYLYADKLKNWNKVEKDIACHSGQTKKKSRRLEVLWTNF